MNEDFATIGRQVKVKSGAYQDLPDEVVGQAYLKKTNPLQYELYKNQVELSKTQSASDIQAQKELDVNKAKMQQELEFKQANPEVSTEGKKDQKAFDATSNFVQLLEQRFKEAKGGEYSGAASRLSGVQKTLAGKLGLNAPAKIYEDQKKGFAATLKQLTGDTGVLTDQDYERLAGLLPSLGATPEEAQAKFNDLRSQMAATFGGEKTQTTFQPGEKKSGISAVAEILTPGTKKLYKSKEDQSLAKNLLETAIPIVNLLKPEGRQAAGEVLSVIGGADFAKKGFGALKEVLSGGRGALATRKAVAEAVEKSGAEVSGDVYTKAGQKALENATPDELPYLKKILAQAEEKASSGNIKPSKALDMLVKSGKKSFTKGGDPKITASGAYNQALREELRNEFTRIAPQVIEETTKVSKILGLRKGLKNTAMGLSIGAGGIAATAYLLNLLKGKGGSQGQ